MFQGWQVYVCTRPLYMHTIVIEAVYMCACQSLKTLSSKPSRPEIFATPSCCSKISRKFNNFDCTFFSHWLCWSTWSRRARSVSPSSARTTSSPFKLSRTSSMSTRTAKTREPTVSQLVTLVQWGPQNLNTEGMHASFTNDWCLFWHGILSEMQLLLGA